MASARTASSSILIFTPQSHLPARYDEARLMKIANGTLYYRVQSILGCILS
jgi:hypothetical protein